MIHCLTLATSLLLSLVSLHSEDALLYTNPLMTNLFDNVVSNLNTWDGVSRNVLRWYRGTASGWLALLSGIVERRLLLTRSILRKSDLFNSRDDIIDHLYNRDWSVEWDPWHRIGMSSFHTHMTNEEFVVSNVYGRILWTLSHMTGDLRDDYLNGLSTIYDWNSVGSTLFPFDASERQTMYEFTDIRGEDIIGLYDWRHVWPEFRQFPNDGLIVTNVSSESSRHQNALVDYLNMFGDLEYDGVVIGRAGDILSRRGSLSITNEYVTDIFKGTKLANTNMFSYYHDARLNYTRQAQSAQAVALVNRCYNTTFNRVSFDNILQSGNLDMEIVERRIIISSPGGAKLVSGRWVVPFAIEEDEFVKDGDNFNRRIEQISTNRNSSAVFSIGSTDYNIRVDASTTSGVLYYLYEDNARTAITEEGLYTCTGAHLGFHEGDGSPSVTLTYMGPGGVTYSIGLVAEEYNLDSAYMTIRFTSNTSTVISIPNLIEWSSSTPYTYDVFESRLTELGNLGMIADSSTLYEGLVHTKTVRGGGIEDATRDVKYSNTSLGKFSSFNQAKNSMVMTFGELCEKGRNEIQKNGPEYPYFNDNEKRPKDLINERIKIANLELIGDDRTYMLNNNALLIKPDGVYITLDGHSFNKIPESGISLVTWNAVASFGEAAKTGREVETREENFFGADTVINFKNLKVAQ